MFMLSVFSLTLVIITSGFSLPGAQEGNSCVQQSTSELGRDRRKDMAKDSLWRKHIYPITNGEPRLEIFSSAIWESHCHRKPSFQHLLSCPTQQKCDVPFPNLVPVAPLHDSSNFNWCRSLEARWEIVSEELEAFLQSISTSKVEDANEERTSWQTSNTALCESTCGFTKLTIQDYQGTATNIGEMYFPRTLALLSSAVGRDNLAPRPININCQGPNSGLSPHSDNMNFLLTCHLGLRIPQNGECTLTIGSLTRSWKAGQVMVADTSFVHSTRNSSPNESRYVLSFNIWHPDLSEKERQAIMDIHNVLQQL